MKKIKKLTVAQVKRRFMFLKTERIMWESHWQEVADYFLTNKNTITNTKSEGQKRTWQLLDNTGAVSLETLAAALNSFLTNPSNKWFSLGLTDVELSKRDDIQRWLQLNTNTMRLVINNSNFTTAVQEFYQELLGFGTGATFVEESDETIVNFSTQFIRDYYIEEGRNGRINGLYREWKDSAQNLAEQFGTENLPKKIVDALKKGTEEKFGIVHCVYPFTKLDPKDKSGKYASQYIIPDCDHEVSYGEYMEFPFGTSRWSKAAGEKYGRSPSMTALPEMKVLNKMNETLLIGAQLSVQPPIQMPDDGFVLPIITRPNGINYYRAGSGDRIEKLFDHTANLDFGYQAMEDRRKRVREAFFIDQLRLPMMDRMTATEVMQRKDETAILLGPMFGRVEPEYLRVILRRVYGILVRRGMITEPPISLGKAQVDVKFTGLIAKAQETAQATNIARLFAASAPLGSMDPSVMQNFNGDVTLRILAQAYDVTNEIFHKPEDVAARRQAIQEGQRAQAEANAQVLSTQQNVDNALTTAKAMKETQGI